MVRYRIESFTKVNKKTSNMVAIFKSISCLMKQIRLRSCGASDRPKRILIINDVIGYIALRKNFLTKSFSYIRDRMGATDISRKSL
jgi:hypothetical protein